MPKKKSRKNPKSRNQNENENTTEPNADEFSVSTSTSAPSLFSSSSSSIKNSVKLHQTDENSVNSSKTDGTSKSPGNKRKFHSDSEFPAVQNNYNFTQLSDSELSSDESEQFRNRTVYEQYDQKSHYELKKVTFATPENQLRSSARGKNPSMPTEYNIDYDRMFQNYSPSILAEIYDDEFYDFDESRRAAHADRINHKEGIFCCLITGLAIGLLLLMAYLIILLLDPITKTIEAIHDSMINATNFITRKRIHYHRKPV
ncbi:uncharacterized protein LOC142238679 [Haematobia irritans]|uniref:uncharacterized protein LOC142238679 n=1 Tax=Haematobia irritans TaxID=7368 RepID=UPI003F50959C